MVLAQSLLVVEDDLTMARVLKQGLEQESYRVTVAHTGAKGLELAQAGGFDGIVLDILLPELDGRRIVRTLRARGVRTPIIMLTALDSVADVVVGLDAGAEDYLTKPFSFLELLARLRALLRRGEAAARRLEAGDLTLDPGGHVVTCAGKTVNLTKTEFLLLEVLLRNAGHVVSRETIAEAVWGSSFVVEQNSIDVVICGLRAKIDSDSARKRIHTIRSLGYKVASNWEEA
jgi:DNA-binding response OmpR family regulator